MRRVLIVGTGVLVAGVGGMLFLGAAVLADAATLRAGTSIAIVGVMALIGSALHGDLPERLIGATLLLAWEATLAVCFLPVFIAALVGEAARTRSLVWYAGASGAIAAAVPSLARAARPAEADSPLVASALESGITLILLLTGIAAGFVYWLTAGRSAGRGSDASL